MESPASSNSPKQLHDELFSPEDSRRYLMWALIWGGASLILLASPLGQMLVGNAHGSNAENLDAAREMALNLRGAGAIIFALGLAERIIGEIAKLKPGAGSS